MTDAATGGPLPGAQIVVTDTQLGAATDLEGRYAILGIRAGHYDVEVRFVGVETVTAEKVRVEPGRTTTLDFVLEGEDDRVRILPRPRPQLLPR